MARGLGAVLFTAMLVAAPARAQLVADPPAESPELDPRVDEARALFQRGVELSRQDRWGEALEYFRRSLAIVERPNTIFNIAGIYVRLGRGTEAVVAYRRYLELAPPDDPDRAAAERALGVAESSVARLELEVSPEDAEVRIDGRRVEGRGPTRVLLLDPGERALSIAARGHETRTILVSALPGDRGHQHVELSRAGEVVDEAEPPAEVRAAPPAPPDETGAHWLVAVGAALAALGGVGLAVGLAARAEVEAPEGRFWSELEGAHTRATVLTPLGAVGLGLGLAGAGLGAGWLLGLRASPTDASIALAGRLP